jgi:glycosyltransferase involved in cell wall biosynthesis
MSNAVESSVAIILAFKDGCRFIQEQIQSILHQTHTNIKIFIIDDYSEMPLNLESLKLKNAQTIPIQCIRQNENLGSAKTFITGLANIEESFDYYAFCDQDDIWLNNKLEKGIASLSKIPKVRPALYCGRTKVLAENMEDHLGYSPLFQKKPSFKNALAQNIAGGNTMVFNTRAKNLIVVNKSIEIVSHDWWAYQIISGAGGLVIYDREPFVHYRQHNENQIGANISWAARLDRICQLLLTGRFRRWNRINSKALNLNKHLLTKENQSILSKWNEALDSRMLRRLRSFKKSGVHRQTFMGNVAMWMALLLGKF